MSSGMQQSKAMGLNGTTHNNEVSVIPTLSELVADPRPKARKSAAKVVHKFILLLYLFLLPLLDLSNILSYHASSTCCPSSFGLGQCFHWYVSYLLFLFVVMVGDDE